MREILNIFKLFFSLQMLSFSHKLCHNGPSCKYLAKGKCRFYHSPSDYRYLDYGYSYVPKAKKYNEFEKYQNDDYDLPQNVNKFAKKYEEEREKRKAEIE